MGANFCHVNIIRVLIHLNPSMISGNQKWNGAAPILVINEEFMIARYVGLNFSIMVISEDISRIIENNRVVEATAWTMKYFRDDSDDRMLFLLFIRGIIDSRLISNPIHIPIHEYEDIAIIVPIIKVEVNMIL